MDVNSALQVASSGASSLLMAKFIFTPSVWYQHDKRSHIPWHGGQHRRGPTAPYAQHTSKKRATAVRSVMGESPALMLITSDVSVASSSNSSAQGLT
jgi:hypothetical protein